MLDEEEEEEDDDELMLTESSIVPFLRKYLPFLIELLKHFTIRPLEAHSQPLRVTWADADTSTFCDFP